MVARYLNSPLYLIDTHAHVTVNRFDHDREEVVKRAKESGISFIEVGFNEESSEAGLVLARNIGIVFAAGIHPHDAKGKADLASRWKRIRSLLEQPEAVAVGEIGLDYFRNLSPRSVQQECFMAGLEIASELNMPVIIHQRTAAEDTISILERACLNTPVIFHCFGEGRRYAYRYLDIGGYFGLGGPLTYPRNSELRDTIKCLPLDRLLLETDSPYLPPQSKRGQRNQPAYVEEVLLELSGILKINSDKLAEITIDNSRKAFGVPFKPIHIHNEEDGNN